jgi:2,5-furandicarboxylate decarboxylase 1
MAQFPFDSVRDWIEFLRDRGQLVENSQEVDLQGEVAAISRKIALTGGPAVLHTRIKGYPGWRLFSDGLATRQRIAWALGLPETGMITALADKLAKFEPIKPRIVATGPCKERIFRDDDIDLVKLPLAYTGEYDIPPFITAGISNIRDSATGWQNTGIRRFQLHGKRRLSNLVLPFQHEGIIFSQYLKKGEPAPIAIVIGADPLYILGSMVPAPDQVDEMDTWCAFAGAPRDVVKCETSELLVPATAELVIEGEMLPTERVLEGPFSEFTGFYSGLRMLPVVDVKCVTMRNDCIYQNMYMSVPISEAHTTGHLMTEVELLRQVRQLAPEVTDLAILSSWGMFTAVAVDKKARVSKPGLAKKVALAVKSVKASTWVKNVVVVDSDVDPHNVHEVLWSMSVKFQGEKDITVIPGFPGTILDPSELYLGRGVGVTSFTFFDCTEKPAPYDEAYKRGVAQPNIGFRRLVEEKWADYGL